MPNNDTYESFLSRDEAHDRRQAARERRENVETVEDVELPADEDDGRG